MDELTKNILINLELLENNPDEAFAAVNLNPTVTWAKFVLTDDLPNGNKQRIPEEEFDNLIKTGIYMPIKMAKGGIAEDHKDSEPIGTIAFLKKVKNQIHGLAALWERERPEDVQMIKDYYKEKKPLQLSWEVLYKNSKVSEAGVEDLLDTALRATTLVGMPAYQGRTPITAVASETKTDSEEGKLEELDKALARITELEQSLAQKDEAIKAKEDELKELEDLRQYKASAEKEKADLEKIASVEKKFTDANITKDKEYFATNKDKFLSMSDVDIDFMIQEFVAFSKAAQSASSSQTGINIPNITTPSEPDLKDPKALAKVLREMKKS